MHVPRLVDRHLDAHVALDLGLRAPPSCTSACTVDLRFGRTTGSWHVVRGRRARAAATGLRRLRLGRRRAAGARRTVRRRAPSAMRDAVALRLRPRGRRRRDPRSRRRRLGQQAAPPRPSPRSGATFACACARGGGGGGLGLSCGGGGGGRRRRRLGRLLLFLDVGELDRAASARSGLGMRNVTAANATWSATLPP